MVETQISIDNLGSNNLGKSDRNDGSSVSSSQKNRANNRESRRPQAGRKDADHEFFQMTLISQIMMHKE